MNRADSIYCQTTLNATLSGTLVGSSFTGKERDEETGYGYFGARYMDHELTTLWLSVDPMSDKYPSISPYAYCAWNPVKLEDPDGREINPVFGTDGSFRGCTNEGYTGQIIIFDGDDDFEDLTADELITTTKNCNNKAVYYDHYSQNMLKDQAKEKMYTHILRQFDGISVGGSDFCVDDMVLKFDANGKGNWNTQTNCGGESQFILTATDKYIYWEVWDDSHTAYTPHGSYEATVENIVCSIVYHEWYGHFTNNISSGPDHVKCYQASQASPYFSKTTELYHSFIQRQLDKFQR